MLLFFSSSAASRPRWVDWVRVAIRCLLKMVTLYGLMAQENVMFKDRRFVGDIINHLIYSRFPVKNVAQSRGAKTSGRNGSLLSLGQSSCFRIRSFPGFTNHTCMVNVQPKLSQFV